MLPNLIETSFVYLNYRKLGRGMGGVWKVVNEGHIWDVPVKTEKGSLRHLFPILTFLPHFE